MDSNDQKNIEYLIYLLEQGVKSIQNANSAKHVNTLKRDLQIIKGIMSTVPPDPLGFRQATHNFLEFSTIVSSKQKTTVGIIQKMVHFIQSSMKAVTVSIGSIFKSVMQNRIATIQKNIAKEETQFKIGEIQHEQIVYQEKLNRFLQYDAKMRPLIKQAHEKQYEFTRRLEDAIYEYKAKKNKEEYKEKEVLLTRLYRQKKITVDNELQAIDYAIAKETDLKKRAQLISEKDKKLIEKNELMRQNKINQAQFQAQKMKQLREQQEEDAVIKATRSKENRERAYIMLVYKQQQQLYENKKRMFDVDKGIRIADIAAQSAVGIINLIVNSLISGPILAPALIAAGSIMMGTSAGIQTAIVASQQFPESPPLEPKFRRGGIIRNQGKYGARIKTGSGSAIVADGVDEGVMIVTPHDVDGIKPYVEAVLDSMQMATHNMHIHNYNISFNSMFNFANEMQAREAARIMVPYLQDAQKELDIM